MKALITGATSGIGYEFSYLLAKKGYDIILIARKQNILDGMKEDIEKKYNVTVEYILCDFTHLDELEGVIEKIKTIDIDVFVNNAGFDNSGEFTSLEYDNIIGMINVNVVTITRLLHCVLTRMKENRRGHVINLSSIAGILPMKNSAVYAAAKAYILNLSMSLYEEYRPYNVYVTAFCPGPTKSNFAKTANVENTSIFSKSKVMTSEEVVRIGYKEMMRNKAIIVPGIKNKMYIFCTRLLSRKLIMKICAKFTSN